MYHWKYIKKKRVNGRWRYYYDKSANELTTLKKEAADAQKRLDLDFEAYYKKMYAQDMNEAKRNQSSNPKGVHNVNGWYSNPKIKERTKETYRDGKYLRNDLSRAKNKVSSHEDSISGKIDSFMEKHGKKIARTLNSVNSYVDKGINWIKKRFS